MDNSLECSICGQFKAKLLKTNIGLIIMCDNCVELGAKASAEEEIHGSTMDMIKPETFKQKPAKSKLWLSIYFKLNTDYKVH